MGVSSAKIITANKRLQEAFYILKERYEELFSTHTLVCTEAHRPVERQKELYAQGRTAPGDIVTNVDGVKKKGMHNYLPSRAIDVAVVDLRTKTPTWKISYYEPLLALVADINKEKGWKLESGGSWKTFKDWPHIEDKGEIS